MSYQREQCKKNEDIIEREMSGLDHQDINDVRNAVHTTWATKAETLAIISTKKDEIKNRATPEEVEDAFKYMKL